MPILDYQCGHCHEVWEVIAITSSDWPLECPKCGAADIHKLVSWQGMFTGEHRKAWDRPAPGNKITVGGTRISKKEHKP